MKNDKLSFCRWPSARGDAWGGAESDSGWNERKAGDLEEARAANDIERRASSNNRENQLSRAYAGVVIARSSLLDNATVPALSNVSTTRNKWIINASTQNKQIDVSIYTN